MRVGVVQIVGRLVRFVTFDGTSRCFLGSQAVGHKLKHHKLKHEDIFR